MLKAFQRILQRGYFRSAYFSWHIFHVEWSLGVDQHFETSRKVSILKHSLISPFNTGVWKSGTYFMTTLNSMTFFFFRNGRINIWKLYAHRLLRLTPLMGATILLSMSLMRFMGNGPVWPLSMDYLRQSCQQYWLPSLLYIQNYVNPESYVNAHENNYVAILPVESFF